MLDNGFIHNIARITSIVEDYGTAKYNSVVAGLLKNSPLVLPK